MERFLKYYKEHKGMALVWITLLLFVFLVLAATAIDISFMYYTKNQLTVAADASALAGVADLAGGIDDTLVDPNVLFQENARRKAWEFACKNKAFGSERKGEPVYLVTDSVADCDSYASLNAMQLNGGNVFSGDIVVGNWDKTRTDPCPSTSVVEPFCPANGGTLLSINAIKVVARRTFDDPVPNVSIGGNPVRVFLGQVFRVLGGGNWPFLSTKAEAIASYRPVDLAPFPVCLPSCSLTTPLKTEWAYDKNQNKEITDHPIYCTDSNLPSGDGENNDQTFTASTTPGQVFLLGPSTEIQSVRQPGTAWTNFELADCNLSPSCNMPNPGEVLPYVIGTGGVGITEICHENICTTNGTLASVLGNQNDSPGDQTLRGQFLAKRETQSISVTYPSGGSETIDVEGWLVMIPILSDDVCGSSSPCPGTQAQSANPYKVEGYSRALVTDVLTGQGGHGVRIVGMENPRQETYTFTCSQGSNTFNKIIHRVVTNFDSLTCTDCTQGPLPEYSEPKLVK